MNKEPLEQRAIRAAEAALADHDYVSIIDVLCGVGRLHESNVEAWKKGRLDVLESMVQGNPEKIASALSAFREWALNKGLRPVEAPYVRSTRSGSVELRFTASGDPDLEMTYRTHFLSPDLPERQQRRIQEKLSKAPQLVVFLIVRDSECSECGVELWRGSFLYKEGEQVLCLACAGMGDLEFLPSGDTALTRRATKHSGRTMVVVRFSRSRGRYERQGILVEPAALERAERECTEDADARRAARERAAAARRDEDHELIVRMTEQIRMLFPGCPTQEAKHIAVHTAERGSGRVGRTEAGRKLDGNALTLAVIAAVRHRHTPYDELLASGVERHIAREQVSGTVQEILFKWRRSEG